MYLLQQHLVAPPMEVAAVENVVVVVVDVIVIVDVIVVVAGTF